MARQPCTCAPGILCAACQAWGEKPIGAPRVAYARQRGGASTLGQQLRAYRQRTGLSQEAVATLLGCSARALKDIERGRTQFPYTWMRLSLAALFAAEQEVV